MRHNVLLIFRTRNLHTSPILYKKGITNPLHTPDLDVSTSSLIPEACGKEWKSVPRMASINPAVSDRLLLHERGMLHIERYKIRQL